MALTQILRVTIISGLFAILFVPFIVATPFFFPFITGKAFAFRILVEIVFALWVVLALRDPSIRPKRSLMLYALLGLIVSLGVSALLGENPAKSFWSNFERMEGLISFLHFGAFFVVLSSVFRDEKLWKRFFGASIGVSVALALYGALQLGGVFAINQGGVRVDATFGNATYLAIYMFFHFFLTLIALVRWQPGTLTKFALGVALALQALMIFYAATRGTILGLVGGLFLASIIFVIFSDKNVQLRKAGAAILAALVLLVAVFFVAKDTPLVQSNEVLTRLAQISLHEGQTRFTIWGMAWRGFLERPVFGWGQEGFNYVFNKYYEPSLYGQEPWFDRAHNEFIDMALAGGASGFLLYVSLFGLALWYLWRPRNPFSVSERALVTGLLAGYTFHNFFVFDNLMSYVLFLSILAYLTVRTTGAATPVGADKVIAPATMNALSATIVIVLVAVLYAANVPGIVRASGLIKAIQPHCVNAKKTEVFCQVNGTTNPVAATQDLGINLDRFKRAVAGGGIGQQEAYEQLVQFALQIRTRNLITLSTDAFKTEVASFTADSFAEEIARAPEDARLRLFYGSYLRQSGDFASAERELAKALELSPRKQAIFFERGLLAFDEGQGAAALGYFKQAYELAPEYGQARVNYAAVLIRAGQANLGRSILQDYFGTETPDNDTVLQAYVAVQDFARGLAIVEGRVNANPDDPQKHIDLAAVYLNANRRTDAVASLKEAIRLNPDFKAQGEYYIQEIEAGRNP
jgi:O-antigen ligase/Flp pilus assembly protein TadD